MHADIADGILIVFLQHEEMNCRKMMERYTTKSRADFGRRDIRDVNHDKTKEIAK